MTDTMRSATRARIALATTAVGLLAAGCGGGHGANTAAPPDRTIDVVMTDNAYQPTAIKVSKGERVLFRFRNAGTARHEAVIGDNKKQDEHHVEMTAATGNPTAGASDHGGAVDGHGEGMSDEATTVEPGKTGEITRTFSAAGSILIGCHEPGHWEAGMKATITIG